MGVQSKVRVCVADNQSKAVELLSALPEIQDVRLMGSYIAVTFEEGQSIDGIIARTLVRGDIDIISLEPEQLKLDDAFLKLTEGIVH